MNDYVYVHKHIDSLPMFLNWEIDVILTFVGSFYIGINFSSKFSNMITFVFIGFILSYLYAKLKSSSIRGYFSHIRYMLNFKQPKTLIPSYQRHFLGK
ncbi:hypothetical protein A9K75_06610 [Campylobacter fetus subsp. testudinum]|uniref:type IV conjugative transfer system protein TraL n=1 Tax=Campylobacter fetus TaxID=196 RepID=UPI0008188179|nr:type IV conjugative transfer system protein TraL [Campylobacter fetus]OCR99537.1 hypothetical protein A9K75_06610 [Campylobacter fetus subsp. testudinum]